MNDNNRNFIRIFWSYTMVIILPVFILGFLTVAILFGNLANPDPYGFPGYTRQSEAITLLNGFSYGAEKSVAVSFGSPSIYYNYFETVDCYVNMYSYNEESMQAFVDGILGEFEFEGKSPVNLYPELV